MVAIVSSGIRYALSVTVLICAVPVMVIGYGIAWTLTNMLRLADALYNTKRD